MPFRLHAFVQDAQDCEVGGGEAVEDNVAAGRVGTQAHLQVVAWGSDFRCCGQAGEGGFEVCEIPGFLCRAPGAVCVVGDGLKVPPGRRGQAQLAFRTRQKDGPGLPGPSGR